MTFRQSMAVWSLLTLLLVLALAGCTDPEATVRTAENHGFKDVKITGYRAFGCGKDDVQSTGFEATAPNGRRITGVVCSQPGIFGKAHTLRLD